MNKFETSGRILSAALAFNVGLIAVGSQEVGAAPKPKLTCTAVSPKYVELVAGKGIVILPEPDDNDQRYQISKGHGLGVANVSQIELHKNKIEITKELDLSEITKTHDVAVNFHDASGVTMQFKGVYYAPSSAGGQGQANIDLLVCKPPQVYAT
jgi:hypothetical protein